MEILNSFEKNETTPILIIEFLDKIKYLIQEDLGDFYHKKIVNDIYNILFILDKQKFEYEYFYLKNLVQYFNI